MSQHLAYLRHAGLVVARKSGLWSYYSPTPAETAFHTKLLECLAHCFSDVPEIQADQRRAAQVRRSGGCCPPPSAKLEVSSPDGGPRANRGRVQ